MAHLAELERNDPSAALEWYREMSASRAVEEWEVRILAKLQDDPAEFLRLLREERQRQRVS